MIKHNFLVLIEEIKEVRQGCASRDFSNVLRRIDDPNCCIVIVYGNNFKLKTLSCLGEQSFFFSIVTVMLITKWTTPFFQIQNPEI